MSMIQGIATGRFIKSKGKTTLGYRQFEIACKSRAVAGAQQDFVAFRRRFAQEDRFVGNWRRLMAAEGRFGVI
jgi:hypothetical protein